jgi:hypothetical protein
VYLCVAYEENGLQIWRVAANILNKQSRTDDKGGGGLPAWGLGVGLTTPHRKKISLLQKFTRKWTGSNWLRIGTSGGSYEHGDEPSGSLKMLGSS